MDDVKQESTQNSNGKSHGWEGYFNENLNKRAWAYYYEKGFSSKSQLLGSIVKQFLDNEDRKKTSG